MKFIDMKVTGVIVDPSSHSPMVILKDRDEKTVLPIWIGIMEAASILTELENIELERPMTHDLTKNIIAGLHSEILNIKVTAMKGNIFYAAIFLRTESGKIIEMDSRPSDAIALAMRCSVPILVNEDVISSSQEIDLTSEALKGKSREELEGILENLDAEDFGKYKM